MEVIMPQMGESVADGAVADRFMAYFKERLENFSEEVVL